MLLFAVRLLVMAGGRIRGLWPPVAIAAIVVVTVAGLYVVWRSPHRRELIEFWGFAAAIAVIAGGRIAWAWRARSKQASGAVSERELRQLADLLAGAVQQEWERAAGQRGLLEPEPIPVRWQLPTAPYAGPVAAAVASKRFAPLPRLAATGERQLQSGQVGDLLGVYGGLGSGRLVIAGAPGSGKSGAAVLLILAILRYRRSLSESDRAQVPVPVMLTLHGWDPSTQRVQDWLGTRFRETYPLFASRSRVGVARDLLAMGRIAVILDGLDEIHEGLRPTVLQALSQQATFRLVLLTRSAEMAAAASHALLQGAAAIELQDIDPGTAADYLTRVQLDPPPRRWHQLTSRLRHEPGSPLAQALNNPLMLTLIRDTYHTGDDIGELLNLRDADGRPASGEALADYLLDRVLPAAYTQRPGDPPPRYDLQTAERTLRYIAVRMRQDAIYDLQWWRLPAWAPSTPRRIAVGLLAGLVAGLAVGVPNRLVAGLIAGLTAGLTAGLVIGNGGLFRFGRTGMVHEGIGRTRWQQLLQRRPLTFGLATVLGVGLLAGLALGALVGPVYGFVYGLAYGLMLGLPMWFIIGFQHRLDADVLNPLTSWRSDRALGLAFGITGWFGLGLSIWLISPALMLGPGVAVPWGLMLGTLIGLALGLSFPQTWQASLAFAELAASERTPIRLMRFLEDARSRSVLRTLGPAYQFRHARLQDRLVEQESAISQSPGELRSIAGDIQAPTTEASTQVSSS